MTRATRAEYSSHQEPRDYVSDRVYDGKRVYPSYPYLNVARQTGADYGTVLRIADAFDRCDNYYITTATRELAPEYGPYLMGVVVRAWIDEQKRRQLVLAEAGPA